MKDHSLRSEKTSDGKDCKPTLFQLEHRQKKFYVSLILFSYGK